ncbi:bifunctional proline dehydrogenase/L-glutamate gamma-semialdehyde dehydrogenase [Rhodobacterales bacterium 52_120_T64]|nr:bifunctional proline dehydrogenase/L-glutamate gamma-semialdehyde dehydrogenase [Rhodobacterales bacterium 52_120_T64]
MKPQFPKFHAENLPDEGSVLSRLIEEAGIGVATRQEISIQATDLVEKIRSATKPGVMESFLAEYGLSTNEGVALMCLAEALLRVPDAKTIDALIEDKIAPSNWRQHLGHSTSALVNASTWGLMLTGKVLDDGDARVLGAMKTVVKRLGEPVIRKAVAQAMREMGRQFVLGETIEKALANAKTDEGAGYTYSYDMLGEAARTEADAKRYHLSYSAAISAMASACTSTDIRENPGISVKLSALHPRYEVGQRDRVMAELVPRVRALALLAKSAGMGFNIDAEEADRLELSCEVIYEVLQDPALAKWDGFGVVVQAYGLRAGPMLDWLYGLAETLDRKIMVRLVKGAYWDTEIKLAQSSGLDGFPVFTRKAATDVSYIANARKLLNMRDRIYPQFATHNAHTVAAVLAMAGDTQDFEFQRLHGMGENLHSVVMAQAQTRCRIYAPVGEHRDLLAYLVRRLLENGANSSFVNQIVDESVPAAEVATDPFLQVEKDRDAVQNPAIAKPSDLFGVKRKNAKGWDLTDTEDLASIEAARAPHRNNRFHAGPMLSGAPVGGEVTNICSPYDPTDIVGTVTSAAAEDIENALANAKPWGADANTRAAILQAASDLYEEHCGEFFALSAREAGKILPDAVSELREAVDFLRYYGDQAQLLTGPACGTIACISPWNFPLAIFTGQIAGALAAGNAVIAKPAEQTPLIAAQAVALLHKAGVPRDALQLLPGAGRTVGAALSSDPRIDGVCFTGSTPTAQHINRNMAQNLSPSAPLIAETGGLNAMIVDSTALPEQAVRDILVSAFQSAGQRCSSLRVLYLQEDIAAGVSKMLFGAMDELRAGNPWEISTDTGPIIDQSAERRFARYIDAARGEGRLLKQLEAHGRGYYIPPTVLKINGIGDLGEEVFGPVLHIATFAAGDIDQVIADINASGFGLTFGVHSRIDDRVQGFIDKLNVGNIYVNRNQVGAVVGSQPFGGEGLSGTGPKAGGSEYLSRLTKSKHHVFADSKNRPALLKDVQRALDGLTVSALVPLSVEILPGPTGESNRLSTFARGKVLCLGPTLAAADAQKTVAKTAGCTALRLVVGGDVSGIATAEILQDLSDINAVVYWGDDETARKFKIALAERPGPLLPLIMDTERSRFTIERHVCIDTTASGGNAELLASV